MRCGEDTGRGKRSSLLSSRRRRLPPPIRRDLASCPSLLRYWTASSPSTRRLDLSAEHSSLCSDDAAPRTAFPTLPTFLSSKRSFLSSSDSGSSQSMSAPEVIKLLPRLPAPELLLKLTLEGSGTAGFESDLASALIAYKSLNCLDIDCPLDLDNVPLVAALRDLPITHLVVGKHTALRSATLLRLAPTIDSQHLPVLSHLKQLDPNIASGEEGSWAHYYLETLREGDEFGEDWVMPIWPAHFPRAGVEKIVRRCSSQVQVGGSAVEAMEVEDRYEGEKEEYEEGKELIMFKFREDSDYVRQAYGWGEGPYGSDKDEEDEEEEEEDGEEEDEE